MTRHPCVYILASGPNGTLYVGVTSDLMKRLHQHREGITGGFTSQYKGVHLIRYEMFETMPDAIAREKQIKAWRREWKLNLIEQNNPDWDDLALGLGFDRLDSPSGRVDAETSSA